MIERSDRPFFISLHNRKIMELVLALLIGLLLGLLVVLSPSLPVSSDFQKLVLVVPFAVTVVILFNNLERFILFVLAISVPLNIDFSIIISPYARNPENIVRGYRTLITTTELRISIALIIILIGYAIWMLLPGDREHKSVNLFPATTIPALGFIFLTVLSTTQAQDQQLAWFRIAQLVEVFLVYFYLANHIRTPKEMQFFLVVALIGLLAENVLIIVQWITGLTFMVAGLEAMSMGPGRIGGTLGNPGPAGGYLSALTIIALSMLWGVPRPQNKVLAAASAGLGIIALVGTGSRIAWVGFVVTIMVFLLAGLRHGWIKRDTLILIAIASLIIGVIVSGVIYERLTASDGNSSESRFMMWKLAWNVIRAHPWLGVGAGNYALITREYYTFDVGLPGEVFDKIVHNAYLGIWAESGTIALLCYLSMLGVAIKQAWDCARSHSPFVSLLGMGIGLAIFSLCIQMITGTFHTRAITLFVWILIALAASLNRIYQTQWDLNKQR